MKQTMKRCASLFLALVLTLQLFVAVPVSAADPDTGVDITSGVTYTETTFENTDAQNCNAFLITVDTEANSDLTFVAGSPNDERPLTEGLCQTTSAQAQEAYLNGRNVVAAINADFFNINDDSQIQPTGLMIQDGVELTPYYEFSGPDDPERDIRVFFGVKEDGTVVLGDETTYEEVKEGE